MVPVFDMFTSRVYPFIDILIPGFKVRLLITRWHDFGRVTAMSEFLFVAVATPRTGYENHKVSFLPRCRVGTRTTFVNNIAIAKS